MTRKELYQFIKARGLEAKVQETFGNHFTRISNEKLSAFVEQEYNNAQKPASPTKKTAKKKAEPGAKDANAGLKKAICSLVALLVAEDIIDEEDAAETLQCLQ